MSTPTATAAQDPKAPIPKQIPYIIGNEGCERFSFYGMRNILTVFLVSTLLMHMPEADRAGAAKDVFHTFVIGVYFFPLVGGWLADRLWGKYNVIFWLSLVYCVGQGCLALFVDNRVGFYTGLRHQAVHLGVRRRSVRPDQQTPREGRVRRVLLDHQFRLVLRVAADADFSEATRARDRVRHPRRAHVHFDGDPLGRPEALRHGAADAAGSALVPARVLDGAALE
jgi:hypothetical protein